MELSNQFTVDVPVERAWAVLTDLPTIAPCLPGAQLQEVEGEEYRGIVKVKVGPIVAQYKGKATFLERDDDAHKAVLKAEGRETKGQGNASAVITAVLSPSGEGTTVEVTTDLKVTGKVAQIGRGVMGDVSGKLMDEFAANLAERVLADGDPAGQVDPSGSDGSDGEAEAAEAAGAPAKDADARSEPADSAASSASGNGSGPVADDSADTERTAVSATGVTTYDSPEPEPIDLLGTAGSPVFKRAAPVLGGVLLLVLILLLRRRRRSD
ncbi:MAG: SRPBCC family protein [Acidimicrobiales bacterium]